MILEVMGRDAGHIALNAAIAGGADVCIIPEIPYTIEGIVKRIEDARAEGRSHALVVVAEGCHTEDGRPLTVVWDSKERRYGGIGHYLSQKLSDQVEAEIRVTVLGHVQRGGQPSNRDRLLASAFGVHAVDLVAEGQFDRVVVWQNTGVTDVSIAKVVIGARAVDPAGDMVHTARGLGTYVGEETA
jgi:6-phosphofructokinase 1